MLGKRIYKPIDTQEKCDEYSKLSNWCRENDSYPKDMGDYYEIVANEHLAPTPKEKALQIRIERDCRINETQWLIERHHDETERVMLKSAERTTLTEAQYQELLEYRQLLREVPQQATFPESVVFPEEPKFVEVANA